MDRKPVHFSDLKHIGRSPAHYLAALDNAKDTPAMRFGRLVHAIVLGGPPSAVWEGTRRGKEWDAFKAAHQDREIVTRAEVDEATRVANAVMADPVAAPYLVGSMEHAITWDQNGRSCATRGLDVLGDGFVTDLKTTTNTEPGLFSRLALRLGYGAQLAWYADAAAAIGRPVRDAYIVAVETSAPYAVTVLHLSPRTIDMGRRQCRAWLERLLACESANEWPAYSQSVVELDVPEEPISIVVDGELLEVA